LTFHDFLKLKRCSIFIKNRC